MTVLRSHRMVGIHLSHQAFEKLTQQAAEYGKSRSAVVRDLVLSNLGIAETPHEHFTKMGLLRRAVSGMSPKQRADYRTFVSKGFSASEAVEKVLGENWMTQP